jgi:phage shock protein C
VLPFYFIAAMVTPTKPHVFERADTEERQFWQGVRASPTRAARDIRSRFKDIDRRLADIESYVTTENRSLAREIDALASDKGANA